jgi:SAM-dependent methyltransferase
MPELSPVVKERLRALESARGVTENDRYYFGYQFGLGHDYVVPYLEESGVQLVGKSICEIGCGEAGVLAAIKDRGAANVVGIDIRQEAIDRARVIFDGLKLKGDFALHNITDQDTPPAWREAFDLVILRDVIEHLDETENSLKHVMEFVKPGGHLYIVFPPYYSPFGAHQHLLKTFWGNVPFIQLLPDAMFKPMTSKARHEIDIEEVSRLRDIKLTIEDFRRASENVGLEIIREELFFLRPVFKMKFGLPTVKANFLRHVPLLRELVALEASYLLKKVVVTEKIKESSREEAVMPSAEVTPAFYKVAR